MTYRVEGYALSPKASEVLCLRAGHLSDLEVIQYITDMLAQNHYDPVGVEPDAAPNTGRVVRVILILESR